MGRDTVEPPSGPRPGTAARWSGEEAAAPLTLLEQIRKTANVNARSFATLPEILTKPEHFDPFGEFSHHEFACAHTGEVCMRRDTVLRLQGLRTHVGFAIAISDGFRAKTHPREAAKVRPGVHPLGRAVDIPCYGEAAFAILNAAPRYGFHRIGVRQHGALERRFIHLDDVEPGEFAWFQSPWVWTYS